jgi:hypothetical protein
VPTEQGCTALPPPIEDDHGDTLAEATAIVPGRGTAELHRKEDLDVFSFQVVAGRIYRFACIAPILDYEPSCAVRLLSATGDVLPPAGYVSYSGYEAPANGTVYAEVRRFSNAARFPLSYQYLLEEVGPDDHGDTPETATFIVPGAGPTEAQVELTSDVDAFAFDAVAGHVFHFACGERYGCRVKLRNAAGSLAHEQNYGLDYEMAVTGRYTLEVAFGPTVGYANVGSYHYSLEDAGPEDHGDDTATATELSFGAPTLGKFDTLEDVDVFRFTAPAGQAVRFSCQIEKKACGIRLKDSAGTLIEDRQQSVAYEAGPTPVVLFAEVRQLTPFSGATYLYRLENLGPDDHGDSAETASPLTGTPAEGTGRLETGTDSDFFRYEAAVGGFYRITCTSTELGCGLRAHGSAGRLGEARYTALEVKATGPLFVEVFGIPFNDRGSYGVRLEQIGQEDHGDTRDTATRLTLGTPVSGNLAAAVDTDVFIVTLEAERAYELTGLSGSVKVTVRDPFDAWTTDTFIQDATPRSLRSHQAGDYLLEVTQIRGLVPMNYQLRLR